MEGREEQARRDRAVSAARLVAWLVPIAQQGDQAIRDSALRPESDLARLRQRDLAGSPVTDPAGGTDPLEVALSSGSPPVASR